MEDGDTLFREVDPVDVVAKGITVSVKETVGNRWRRRTVEKNRQCDDGEAASDASSAILSNVSAVMPRGTLTAIMGSSGSGKTSLLNVLSGRQRGEGLNISGSVTLNGSTPGKSDIRQAYVMQQDCLISTLTVRETLRYSADLRLAEVPDRQQRETIVEQVIRDLGLKECVSTRIGDGMKKGCSGGEMRRTSIGVQLLSNPSVIYADEPSTGLDSTSAFHVIKALKNLANKGRTVVITIHQPRSEIWDLFDRVVLLSRGSTMFAGSPQECISHFSTLGHELPPFVNPADYFVDLLSIDTRSSELESQSLTRVNELSDAWSPNTPATEVESKGLPKVEISAADRTRVSVGTLRQIQVLTRRTLLITLRDPLGLSGSFLEAVLMGFIAGWIFFKMDGSLAGIRSRQSSFYVAASLQGYLILLYETFRMTKDVEVFDRERSEGAVNVAAFLISRRIAKLTEDILVPFIFTILFYFMAGYRQDPTQFFIFFSIILIVQFVTVAFATLCVSLFRDFPRAALVANLSFTFQTYSCGFFAQVQNLPVYVRWSRWAAYVFYAFGALNYNEFAGHFYDCPEEAPANATVCLQYSGDFQVQALGIPSNWVWRPIVALLAFFFLFYSFSALSFTLNPHEIKMGRSFKGKDEQQSAAIAQSMKQEARQDIRQVRITLEEYTLGITKQTLPWRSTYTEVVKPLTVSFEPGKLNVIMGPSGCGKTSLLSSIAQRLKNSTTTKYTTQGKLLLNDAQAPAEAIRSIVSYVTQDDDALLPALTVRETLRFAAGLRLPSFMSAEEKARRAEEVLLKMGLKDCANNVIGSDLIKGISGGEKRRVTIAIQLLTDPKVLLLDEPTSGLDAFTAQSIMDLFHGLANEGRTVILAIHQSRSDLWPLFENVLLLARGGHSVYSGPGDDMLKHFSSLGHRCPEHTNPADFALDLITIDLRRAESEGATREKVQKLIEAWKEVQASRPCTPHREISSPAELGSLQKSRAKFTTAFPILVRRSMLNFWRERDASVGRIMQVAGYGIVLALFFAPLHHNFSSIQTRLGYVSAITVLYFVGMLQNVAVYPSERNVFYKEHADRAYSVEAFFVQYTALELPFEIITALLFALLGDLAIGLPRTVEAFFALAYCCFCIVNCGESLGILFKTIFDHAGFAINVTSIILSLGQIMAGAMSINMPSVLNGCNYLSPLKYGLAVLASYAFRGLKFSCTAEQMLPTGKCPQETGEEILKLYKLDKSLRLNVMALGICVVSYRIVAYAVLKISRDGFRSFITRS